MGTASLIKRVCRCGCGESFAPPASRPGQEYKHRHKGGGAAAQPKSGPKLITAPDVKQRRTLDYRLALSTANAERNYLESEIEALDEQMNLLRDQIAVAQKKKDALVERHLVISTAISVLTNAVDGTPIVLEG